MKKLNLITTLLAVFIVLMGCKKECTFVYSAWTSCSNSIQTRTYTSSPSGCTGTPPADSTQRPCVMGKIGDQIWTLTNLDVATYRNGDAIPQVQDVIAWSNLTTGAWCYYENTTTYGSIYGKLYNWYAVNDSRGLAPTGYHIPTDAEWTTLTTYLGGTSVAGGKMKESGISHWQTQNIGATNSSGFTGLPGGYRFSNGDFYGIGTNGYWWGSSEGSPGLPVSPFIAWYRSLYYDDGVVVRNYYYKTYGFSVRCLRD